MGSNHSFSEERNNIDSILIQSPPPNRQSSFQGAPVQPPVSGQGQNPQYSGDPQSQITPSGGVQAKPTTDSRRDAAFNRAILETLPMTPGQIRDYRKNLDETRRAITAPINPGKPVSRSVRLTLKPGEPIPTIRTQPGMVTSLTFSDVSGQPWPVLSVTTGNPAAYVAQTAGPEGKTNIIILNAIQEHVPGNLAVALVGYPVPVNLALSQDAPETDFRVDISVSTRGPNATQDIIYSRSLSPTNDSILMKFLDGTPPDYARKMKSSSSSVEAWKVENLLYVRTRGEVLSPGYTQRASSVSGYNIFTLAESPVIIISENGQNSSVRINR